MKTRPPFRHLDDAGALDFLEGRLPAARRSEAEDHLASACAACHERVRGYGRLLEVMRRDRTPEVPDAVRARALGVFQPVMAPAAGRATLEGLARLIFDSWVAPLPAAARRAVGEVRRLRFALGTDLLELEVERESEGGLTLRGWLEAPDPALYRLEITARSERFVARPDSQGAFAVERLPRGRATLTLTGPGVRYRLGKVEL